MRETFFDEGVEEGVLNELRQVGEKLQSVVLHLLTCSCQGGVVDKHPVV